MDEAIKERLKNYKPSTCEICGRRSRYTNPLWRCYECRKKFCTDHIYGGQLNASMKKTETIRDICESCKKKFNYYAINSSN